MATSHTPVSLIELPDGSFVLPDPYTGILKFASSGGVYFSSSSNEVNFSSGDTINTLTGNSGGAISPTSGNINIQGTGNVSVAGAGDTLTISDTSDAGIIWEEKTTPDVLVSSQGVIANSASLLTLTLPTTASIGDTFLVCGKGAGGWSIAQNAGQTIHFNSTSTTTGTGGSLSSTAQYNAIKLICTTDNTEFTVLSSEGNITVV